MEEKYEGELKGLREFRDKVLSGSWCQSTHCAMHKANLQAKVDAVKDAMEYHKYGGGVPLFQLREALRKEGDIRGI